jgi:hypothetical protein
MQVGLFCWREGMQDFQGGLSQVDTPLLNRGTGGD